MKNTLYIILLLSMSYSQTEMISIELNEEVQGFTTDVTMTVSQTDGESSIFSVEVNTDEGSFNFAFLDASQVIGYGNSTYGPNGIDSFFVDIDIQVHQIFVDSIYVLAIITDTNDPNLEQGEINGGYVMANLATGGIQVYTENPTFVEGDTSWKTTSSLTIYNLFENPIVDSLTFDYVIVQPDNENSPIQNSIIIPLQPSDGFLSVLDVISMVKIILSQDCPLEADMNSDSNCNILDIVQLVNLILSS